MKSTVAVAPLSAPNIFQHNELNERNLTDFEIQIRDAARKKKAALDETESVMSWHTATMIKEAESEPTKMMTAFDVHSLKAAALANQRKQLKDCSRKRFQTRQHMILVPNLFLSSRLTLD